MAVLADYSCAAHGIFESMTGHCPSGCSDSFVNKVFLQAPGLTSARTKNIDGTLRGLAADFGLTDLNNQNGTSAVIRPDPRKIAARDSLMGKLGETANSWGEMQPGGVFQVGKGAVPVDGRAGQGAISTLASVGARADNALEAVKPALMPPKPLIVGRHDAKIEASI